MKTIVVMGNGPSLKGVDFSMFSGFHTFGMNLAYRHWSKINWWPTYYGCFDKLYTDGHAAEILDMIEDKNNKIQTFFLLRRLCNSSKICRVQLNGDVGTFSMDMNHFGNGGNTGVNCCQVATCLGYKKIVLIGIDCNFIEVVKDAIVSEERDTKLTMAATPKNNPNYFIDDYHRAGESHNKPNVERFHVPAWEKFASFADENGVDVVNCSPISTLEFFRKSTLKKELEA